MFTAIFSLGKMITCHLASRFTVAGWLTLLAATPEVMGLDSSLGNIFKIHFLESKPTVYIAV